MKTSVIIPTYNEESVIQNCLDSLKNQTEKQFEIIVVDDGSNDNTLKLLSSYKKGLDVKIYTQNHKGAGAARNLGASKSLGEILVFVDADMTFDKNFLKNLVAPIKDGFAKGTWSKEEYVSNWENNWARCWNINENWEIKRRHPINYPDTQPVFRAVLKKEFRRVGGYNPGGYTDDWSLYNKLGYKAVNAKDAIFYHKNPASLLEIYHHAKWVGKRKYKFGLIGYFVGLLRASLPVSLVIGTFKSLASKEPSFIVFKIVYDLGLFVGIINYVISGKGAK